MKMIVFQISDYYKDLDTLAIFIIRVVLVQSFVRLYHCKKYYLKIESSLHTSTYIFIIKLPLSSVIKLIVIAFITYLYYVFF
jgi:hypothetical protein